MKRIAIVEDDAAIRQNYGDALKRSGYEVETYADRTEATIAFKIRLPDLAILDIGLSDEIDGGFTLCRDLRGLPRQAPDSSVEKVGRSLRARRLKAHRRAGW